MTSITPKKLLKILRSRGFLINHQRGSHIQLIHPGDPSLHVTIPLHEGDLKQGTLSSVLRQAKLTRRDLFER